MTSERTIRIRRSAGETGSFLLWLLLRPARAVCLRRLANILVLSVAGLVFVMLLELTLGTQVRRLAGLWAGAGVPVPVVAAILLLPLALSFVVLVRLGLHLGHLRCVLVYPPVWLAPVLTTGAMILLQRSDWPLPLPKFDSETWLWSLGIWIAASLLYLVGVKLLTTGMPVQRRSDGRGGEVIAEHPLRALTADPEQLLPWLELERPVENPERDDLFDLRYVGQRIAEHFFDPRLATVGLVGPFGVGKSSIVKFVRHYVESDRAFGDRMRIRWHEEHRRGGLTERYAPRILLCPLSAWGLRDQPGAVVILRHAVQRLTAVVDCLSVSDLPEQYAKTLKGIGPEWLNLPMMLSANDDAEEQLRRLEPILEAINARLIVVVEDLDRNVEVPDLALSSQEIESPGRDAPTRISTRFTTRSSGRIARELEALFSRLLDLERVSFVLVVANPGAADLSRLCERIEPVHRIERALVPGVVGTLRTHCLKLGRERGDIQPAHESTLNFMGALHEWSALDFNVLGERTPVTALAELLRTPRALKQALRHTWQSWADLHGEVDFDDLLICHVIRAVSPSAFDFLMENYGALSGASPDRKLKDELSLAWAAQLRDCSQDERELLWTLAGFLFPGIAVASRSPSPPQGVLRTVYWDRVVRGRVAERVRDQEVLRAIATWKQDGSDNSIASKLAGDEAFADAFERVVEGFPRNEFALVHEGFRRLTSQVVEIGILVHHAEACDDTIPGFIPLRRRARASHENEGLAEWLWEEIQKALPHSLAMANDLECWFCDDNMTTFPRDEREQIRNRTIAWAQEHLTAEMLAQNLGRSEWAALYQFVTRRHLDPAPPFQATSWRWLVPRIIGAMEIAPDVVTPQVCLLLCCSQTRRKRDASKQWRQVSEYGLDATLLEELAPGETDRRALLERLAVAASPTLDIAPQIRAIVEAVRDDARRVLQSFGTSCTQAPSPNQKESQTQPPVDESNV